MAEACLGAVDALYATRRRSADARELLFTSAPADPGFDAYRDHPAFVAGMNAWAAAPAGVTFRERRIGAVAARPRYPKKSGPRFRAAR